MAASVDMPISVSYVKSDPNQSVFAVLDVPGATSPTKVSNTDSVCNGGPNLSKIFCNSFLLPE